MLLTIIVFVLVLSVLIFVHELGHFWVSRKMGVKVEEFGFGLPPRLCGWRCFVGQEKQIIAQEEVAEVQENLEGITNVHEEITEVGILKSVKKWKFFWGEKQPVAEEGFVATETIYSLNWLPLGGFCKIKGDNGEGENDPDSFISKAIWKRICIITAGVVMNVVLAAFLFGIGYMIGLPQSIEDTGRKAMVSDGKIIITQLFPNKPAAQAGMKAEDVIEAIDGKKFTRIADIQAYVNENVGRQLSYSIRRADKNLELKITPAEINGKGGIGVGISNIGLVKYPWYLAPWKGIETAIVLLWMIIVAFYELIKGIFMGHGVSADVGGPVMIAQMTGQYARLGLPYLLQFVGLLSLNLAVINFLPLPALDGGRIIFLLIEKIKGSPVKREVEAIIHNIGFMALILLILIITVKDLSGFAAPLVALWQRIF